MANLKTAYEKPLDTLDKLGDQLSFYGRALAWAPRTIVHYKKEILRILAETTLGSGSLAVIGGTVGVIVAMCFFTGTEVGLQGYAALNQLGTANFAGFVSAYFNTREIAPLVAGIALAATVGCGFTAQLGAMRISEEVDALEVMAIPSMLTAWTSCELNELGGSAEPYAEAVTLPDPPNSCKSNQPVLNVTSFTVPQPRRGA